MKVSDLEKYITSSYFAVQMSDYEFNDIITYDNIGGFYEFINNTRYDRYIVHISLKSEKWKLKNKLKKGLTVEKCNTYISKYLSSYVYQNLSVKKFLYNALKVYDYMEFEYDAITNKITEKGMYLHTDNAVYHSPYFSIDSLKRDWYPEIGNTIDIGDCNRFYYVLNYTGSPVSQNIDFDITRKDYNLIEALGIPYRGEDLTFRRINNSPIVFDNDVQRILILRPSLQEIINKLNSFLYSDRFANDKESIIKLTKEFYN